MTTTRLPTGEPLIGRFVRLDLLTEADLPALHPVLADPEVYAHGYVMHRRPSSPEDAVTLARQRFMTGQGAADGRGGGRTAYAVRLVDDGTLVGTSSLLERTSRTRASTSARLSTAAAGGRHGSIQKRSCCSCRTASTTAGTAA